MSILVVADHNNSDLQAVTANVVAAATKIGGEIHVLVAGSTCAEAAAAAAKLEGVSKVLVADNTVYAHKLAENLANLVAELGKNYSHILSAATGTGKNFMPRAAALLDVEQISEISAVISADTFQRPIYAGNAVATVQSADAIKVITVRGTSFDPVATTGTAAIEQLDLATDAGLSSFVSEDLATSDRPDLTSAKVVIAGGRGLGSEENFNLVYQLADKLGGAVGATRAAVDAGYVANDLQIGQTGKIVAPELYIGVGLSGAIQHLAGMKDSKVIVAINKDPEAPVFQVADYGLVADVFEVLPELQQKL